MNDEWATRGLVLSVVHAQAFPSGDVIGDARRLVHEYGFGSIETVGVPDRPTPIPDTGAQIVLLAGLPLLRAGLSLSTTSDDDRRAAVRAVERLIDDAVACGATRLLLTSGPDVEPSARARARAALVESLTELADYAAASRPDLVITLEPTDQALAHRQLIGPTEHALEVVDDVALRRPNVELNLDVSHLLQLGEDPVASLTAAVDRSRHVHLANCLLADPDDPLYGERHPPFGYPGSEVGPDELVTILRGMAAAGYVDPARPTTLGIEVVPPAGTDPWQVLSEAHDVVVRALTEALPAQSVPERTT